MKNENERDLLCMLCVVRSLGHMCVTCYNTNIPMALCASFCNFFVIYVFFCYICTFLLFQEGIVSNLPRQITKMPSLERAFLYDQTHNKIAL